MTAPLTVLYGRDADVYLVARDADRALEGFGCLVSVEHLGDDAGVWITRRGTTNSTQFLPGQLLVIESSGAWRIENTPEVAP